MVTNELWQIDEQCQQTEEQVEELKENIAVLQKSLTPYNEIQSKLNEMISSNHGFYRVIAERDETIRALQGQLAEEAEIIEKSKAERESMYSNMQEMLSKAKPPAKAKSPTPAKASTRSSRSKSESSITRQALELTCSPSKSEFDYNAFIAPKSPAKKSATKAASNVKSPAKSPSNTLQMAATSGKRKLGEDSTWKKAESETALPRYSAKPDSATAPAERGIDMSFVKKEIDSKEKRPTTEQITSLADKGKGPDSPAKDPLGYDSQDSDFMDLFA